MAEDTSNALLRQKVLLVDTLSSGNDFGVDLPIALDPLVDLTVFTIKGTRLRQGDCSRIIEAFPEYWGTRKKFQKLIDQILATARLAVEILRHRRGVVHVQFFRSTAFELPLYILLRPFLSRLVYTAHNAIPHERKSWHPITYRLWYLLVDRVHVLSRHTGDLIVRHFGVSASRIVYAPHGSYERFLHDHPSEPKAVTRGKLGLGPTEKIVLYFGLIRPYKGVDRLINAAPYLATENVRIVVAGGCTEPLLGELRQQIVNSAAKDKILFLHGHVDNRDLSDYLAAADVVVFPYQHIYQSGAALLAMTYGKPVIASDLDGFREYVRHGETGWIANTTNPESLAQAVDMVLGDRALAERIGNAAREACQSEFSWMRVARVITSELYGDA